jgi:L-amino acid N-acyltransferase YncA
MLIRHADPTTDAAGCLDIYGPFAADSPASFEDGTPTLPNYEHRIERINRTHAFLVAEDSDGTIAGFAYAGTHRDRPAYRWTVEASVYLGERYRGRGLGKALYEPLFALIEEQGYRMVLAGITVPNAASEALHRGLGFEEVGVYKRIGWKAGDWRDVIWLARQLGPDTHESETPPSPGAPVRLAQPIEF